MLVWKHLRFGEDEMIVQLFLVDVAWEQFSMGIIIGGVGGTILPVQDC